MAHSAFSRVGDVNVIAEKDWFNRFGLILFQLILRLILVILLLIFFFSFPNIKTNHLEK